MRYAALFRGINIGGKNIVKMAELKNLFAGLGFANVQTYIQSGNVVFDADEAPVALQGTIQQAFIQTFGFKSALMLRTKEEIAAIMASLPFSAADIAAAEAADPAVQHLYIYLLEGTPSPEMMEQLTAGYHGADQLAVGDRVLYLLCHESIRTSKLAAALGKISLPMTSRNWNTLGKLRDLLAQ